MAWFYHRFAKKVYMFPYKGSFKLSDGYANGTYEIIVPEGYAEAVEVVKNALGDRADEFSSLFNGVSESTVKRVVDYALLSIRLALDIECGVGYDDIPWGTNK